MFRQIPHFNHDMIEGAKAFGLQSVDDILSMPEESRNELLKDLSQNQVSDVAVVCIDDDGDDFMSSIATDTPVFLCKFKCHMRLMVA